ncbi:hypothetical protein [Tardiphaga sp. OK246]|jgi:hypothetical protein|nr:hypothetical protein [Tardiphaga sp. OK246]
MAFLFSDYVCGLTVRAPLNMGSPTDAIAPTATLHGLNCLHV